jgi:metal-dependent amidase/aminoacylase/carboxypeptidase family protein
MCADTGGTADALKGIGHACGHNLIAAMSLAGALATAETMKKEGIGGRVVLFGTPAEGLWFLVQMGTRAA